MNDVSDSEMKLDMDSDNEDIDDQDQSATSSAADWKTGVETKTWSTENRCFASVHISLPSTRCAVIVRDALIADPPPPRSAVKKTMRLEGCVLRTNFESSKSNEKKLHKSIDHHIDMSALVMETVEKFDTAPNPTVIRPAPDQPCTTSDSAKLQPDHSNDWFNRNLLKLRKKSRRLLRQARNSRKHQEIYYWDYLRDYKECTSEYQREIRKAQARDKYRKRAQVEEMNSKMSMERNPDGPPSSIAPAKMMRF